MIYWIFKFLQMLLFGKNLFVIRMGFITKIN